MGKPAARSTDMHACPMVTGLVPHVGGPVTLGSPNVITVGMPQARVSDMLVCVGQPDVIAMGSSGVFVNNLPAARLGDQTAHGGTIVLGAPTVLIGETGAGGGGGGAGAHPAGAVHVAFTNVKAQVATLKAAAKSGTPFCQACFDKATKAAKAAKAAKKQTAHGSHHNHHH